MSRQRHVLSPVNEPEHLSLEPISQQNSQKFGSTKHDVTLKRHLGLFSGVCFIVGVIIGKLLYTVFSYYYHLSFLFRFWYLHIS